MHVQKQTPCTHIHRNEFAMYYTSLSLKLAEFKAQGILQPFIAKKVATLHIGESRLELRFGSRLH